MGTSAARERIAGLFARIETTVAWIDAEIARIDADERFHYPPANVQVNVVLALEQMGMGSRHDVLKQVRAMLTGATATKGGGRT